MIADVPRCTKVCAQTGNEIQPGQVFYALLFEEEEELKRLDYSVEGWKLKTGQKGPIIGWWKSRIPTLTDKKAKLAPNDVLLKLFEQLAEQLDKEEMRYVLALLLIRRRLFRLEREEEREGRKKMILYCPKQDCSYEIDVAIPSSERIEQVQNELAALM
ncbi:MAG: hypothetical protein ACRC10_04780 [Thermoguttaceae bacterium]